MRRQDPPPTSRAETATLRNGRPARSGRAISRSSKRGAPQRQLVADRLGEGERLCKLHGRRPPAHAAALPAAREPPRPPPLRPQPLRDGSARQAGEVAEPAHAEPFELGIALRQRQKRER